MLGLWGVPPRFFTRRSKFIALLLSSLLFPARSELPLEDLLSISETELMSSVFPGASLSHLEYAVVEKPQDVDESSSTIACSVSGVSGEALSADSSQWSQPLSSPINKWGRPNAPPCL